MDIKVRNLDNSLIKKFDKIAKSKGVSRQVFLKKELEKIGDKQELKENDNATNLLERKF